MLQTLGRPSGPNRNEINVTALLRLTYPIGQADMAQRRDSETPILLGCLFQRQLICDSTMRQFSNTSPIFMRFFTIPYYLILRF